MTEKKIKVTDSEYAEALLYIYRDDIEKRIKMKMNENIDEEMEKKIKDKEEMIKFEECFIKHYIEEAQFCLKLTKSLHKNGVTSNNKNVSLRETIDYEKVGMDFLQLMKENNMLFKYDTVNLEKIENDLLNHNEMTKKGIRYLKEERDKEINAVLKNKGDSGMKRGSKVNAWFIMDSIINIFNDEVCTQSKMVDLLVHKYNKPNRQSLSNKIGERCKEMQDKYDLIYIHEDSDKKTKPLEATSLGKICFKNIERLKTGYKKGYN